MGSFDVEVEALRAAATAAIDLAPTEPAHPARFPGGAHLALSSTWDNLAGELVDAHTLLADVLVGIGRQLHAAATAYQTAEDQITQSATTTTPDDSVATDTVPEAPPAIPLPGPVQSVGG